MLSDLNIRLRSLFRRTKVEEELDDELRFHLEQQVEKYMHGGMSREAARRRVRLEFGGVDQIKENCRDARGVSLLEALSQDVRYGLRMLRKSPAFTAVVVVTLSLGIGVNSAIFSLVDGIILRPLPYPQSNAIVHFGWLDKSLIPNLSVPEFQFCRDHATSFAAIAGFQDGEDSELSQGATKRWVASASVTDGFFETLGTKLELGRPFGREFTRPGGGYAAVLTDSLWRSSFRADPDIVGRQIVLDNQSFTVAGVLPPTFRFTERADVFTSLHLGNSLGDQGMNTDVIARLKPGVSLSRAQSEVRLLGSEFLAQAPPAQRQGSGVLHLDRYQDYLSSDYRTTLLMLLCAVGLLLLIACANIASLLLGRASSRQREISIRLSLGATRARLLQQFLAEGLLLGVAGSAAGLAAAVASLHVFVSAVPWGLPATDRIALDWRVMSFTTVVAIGASVVFGFASFFQTRKLDPNSALKDGRAVVGAGRGPTLILNGLVVGEVAFSLMLVLGAGLLIDSLYRLSQINLGFNPAHLVLMQTPFSPNMAEAKPSPDVTVAKIWSFEHQALARIRAIPGVQSAAVVSVAPLHGQGNIPVQRDGHSQDSIGGTEYRSISSSYFSTMGIPLLRGRTFHNSDFTSSSHIAIINETLAREWWPNEDPIGDRVVIGEYQGHQYLQIAQPALQVIGVVADTKGILLKAPAPPMVYVPAASGLMLNGSTDWVIRTSATAGIEASLQKAITDIAPEQRIIDLEPMTQLVGGSVAEANFEALLMGIFGALALILTLVGVYGVLSFQVAQRTQEIGIRLALGATRRDIRYLIVGKAAKMAAAGVLIGLLSAFVLTRLMASLLYQVRPTDPAIFASVAILVLLVALVVAYIPSRRAARIDPMILLRYE
ncbi:MAG TPA: ABC transporter permease [Acidobacteriaceae bacterium]